MRVPTGQAGRSQARRLPTSSRKAYCGLGDCILGSVISPERGSTPMVVRGPEKREKIGPQPEPLFSFNWNFTVDGCDIHFAAPTKFYPPLSIPTNNGFNHGFKVVQDSLHSPYYYSARDLSRKSL